MHLAKLPSPHSAPAVVGETAAPRLRQSATAASVGDPGPIVGQQSGKVTRRDVEKHSSGERHPHY